jgi:hypothetical protein
MTSPLQLSDNKIEQVQALPYFKNSIYHNLNIEKTIDFFTRRYIQPLARKFDLSASTVVDCGTGFGWFSFAYLLAGGKAAIAVDMDSQRLATAEHISTILSVHDRMEFIVSPIQNIPLAPDSADIFVSIETLEHIGKKNIRLALERIKGITSQGILITSPNKLFPIVAHDTRLPFIHWLPPGKRKKIVKIFRREKMDQGNEFLFPFNLNSLLEKFQPCSKCLAVEDFKAYRSLFPIYLPYGSDENTRFLSNLSRSKALYYNLISVAFRQYSYWLMPSLAVMLERR